MDGPTEIALQALDAIGVAREIGDITDGSRESRVLLRAYRECRKQLLRAAHWDFARKEAPLLLLADAAGASSIPNTDGVSAPVGTIVPGPFRFSYAYPDDCVKARSVPLVSSVTGSPAIPAGNIGTPNVPPTTAFQAVPLFGWGRRVPSARFIITTDANSPPAPGQITDLSQGVSPQGRTVVLTDVSNAALVYTFDATYPANWDPLFRAALVSYIASDVAMALHGPKLGLGLRRDQIMLTKEKIAAARMADGNEGTVTTDHTPDWIRGRSGGWCGAEGRGFGEFGYGWNSLGFSDGSVC